MKVSSSSPFLGSPPMKRFLVLSIGCSACLIAGAASAVNAAESKTTINAKGEVPSACFVTGSTLPLALLGRNDLSVIGATDMQSSGPATFALDKVSISGPELAMAGGLSASVSLTSTKGELTATALDAGSLALEEPLVDGKVKTIVKVSSNTGVLVAGTYELSTTLTCVSK